MKVAIPELMAATAFAPEDLAVMQQVFDEACEQLQAHDQNHRAAIASIIFSAYQAGERDRQKLFDAALAAAL